MAYDKPSLRHEEQADQLISRGMGGDRKEIVSCLKRVNYYRMSGYWYPFRETDPADSDSRLDKFKPDTTFEEVYYRYEFDRHLRLVVLDAIECIEVAVRSLLAYHHSQQYGPFSYASDPSTVPDCKQEDRERLLASLEREAERSQEVFVTHFQTKYAASHKYLPVWMAVEIMTFGMILSFYRSCPKSIRKMVAKPFEVHETVFSSWLLALNTARNICAHHGRLWNRSLGNKPQIPKKIAEWHRPVEIKNQRLFGILTICKWSLERIAPTCGWTDRLHELLSQYERIPLARMGFPKDWESCPIW